MSAVSFDGRVATTAASTLRRTWKKRESFLVRIGGAFNRYPTMLPTLNVEFILVKIIHLILFPGSGTGEKVDKDAVHNLSPQGYPLLVRYDLERIKATLSKQDLLERPQELWRYRELLPIQHSQNIVSLGEIVTPIITLPTIAQRLSTAPIYVKVLGVEV